MSLADTLARVVRAVDADTDAEGVYECKNCSARYDLDRQTCPNCGGCTIDRIEWGGTGSK